jgi:tRNA pseudouridine13 synthase
MEAVNSLANILRSTPKSFGFAGVKDARACTTQQITVFKQDAKRIQNAVRGINFGRGGSSDPKSSGAKGLRVGHFSYVQNDLRVGDLKGNRFTIVLRGIPDIIPASVCIEALEQVRTRGFPNYYGMQRFGRGQPGTHTVGVALIKGDYAKAVALILAPREGEPDAINEARQYFCDTRDAQGTLEKLPSRMWIERRVLEGLRDLGVNNFLGALMNVPRAMRMMYAHAVQSFMFNHIVTLRLGLDANCPLAGDLVLVDPIEESELEISSEEAVPTAGTLKGDSASPVKDVDDAKMKPHQDYTDQSWINRVRNSVKALSAEEAASGKYKISDVVLPIPGYAVTLPQNDVGRAYADLLARFELVEAMSSAGRNRSATELCLPGGYRRMLVVPGDLKYQYTRYDDVAQTLTHSDADRLDNPALTGEFVEPSSTGAFAAMMMAFSLPSSSYATMLIREVTKQDTTAYGQKLVSSHNSLSRGGGSRSPSPTGSPIQDGDE